MQITDLLQGSNPYAIRARSCWRHLTDEQRESIAIGFARHSRACKSLEIEPDPAWIAEAVDDVLKGEGVLGRRY